MSGQLPFRHVIHAVGPVWSGGSRGEERLLRSAYRAGLELASEHGCQSVAFPALSTGAYRYPLDEAARVAIETTIDFLRELPDEASPSTVRFVLFSADSLAAFRDALGAVSA